GARAAARRRPQPPPAAPGWTRGLAERALQPVEEPVVLVVGLFAGGLAEAAEQVALLLGQAAGDGDVDPHVLVAAPEALEHGHSFPAEDAHRAGLRARFELELSLTVEGRHGDLRAERRLGHRQRHARIDVVALTDEVAVRAHGDAHVDVAGAGTRRAGMALARDADALAVVNPGRNVDVERALLDDTALAAALAARCLDHP